MIGIELENILEQNFIKKLNEFGYEYIKIKDEWDLKENFKSQLEKFNNIELSNKEFDGIYLWLNRGNNFDRAIRIRNDAYELKREDQTHWIKFLDKNRWCENIYQVANQIKIKNHRYDVTILINGLPMVQVELKRQGETIKQAFKQIHRYKHKSFKDLFKFIQIFIISNGNETKYFATNEDSEEKANYKFAFRWSDEKNNHINNLLAKIDGKESFVESFLPRCQLGKMITKYMIIQKETREIKVLRPYQFYAVEKIYDSVEKTNKSGFIWHTTGSGKTLTSFKVAQEIKNNINKIDKVFFVVDRRDLNSQTDREFRKFDNGEDIINPRDTKELIKDIKNDHNNLVVTTIQKFNKAIGILEGENSEDIKNTRNKRVVLIFDEAHRSQFGEANRRIRNFFKNHQLIGFTGTPIKSVNSNNKFTTDKIFGNLIHDYKISEAIKDGNVLGFMIQHLKTYNLNENISVYNQKDDKTIEEISFNKKEVWEHPTRIKNIVRNVFQIHHNLTNYKNYNALFTISSIDLLKKYYEEFKRQNELLPKDKKLNIAAIYSITNADNDDLENDDYNNPSEDFLKQVVKDFNDFNNKKINLNSQTWFNDYRNLLIDSIKKNDTNDPDITLVVNMLTTGFDSKLLNTLYVDKNLEYHGLIQAFSRTNRIDDSKKTQGNIICYSRPNPTDVDNAIIEFSSNEDLSKILKRSYEEYVSKFNQIFKELKSEFSSFDELALIAEESKKQQFINLFKDLKNELNLAKTFYQFNFDDLECKEQEYENYQGKYLEIYRENRTNKDQTSILHTIDFEIETIKVNRIDYEYINKLLEKHQGKSFTKKEYEKAMNEFNESLKRSVFPQEIIDLIIEFVNRQLGNLEIENDFVKNKITANNINDYLRKNKEKQLIEIVEEFKLPQKDFFELIRNYENYEKTNFLIKKSIKRILNSENYLDGLEDNNKFNWKEKNKLTNKIIDAIDGVYDTYKMVRV